MSESELPIPSEPALPEAEEHDHEHHEHDHSHEQGEARGVLKTTGRCGAKCANCLARKRRTAESEAGE